MRYSSSDTSYTTLDENPLFVVPGRQPARPPELPERTGDWERLPSLLSAKTLAYVLFVSLFAVEMGIAALHPDALLALQPWQWLAFGFAAFRGARALSYNGVFGWLRQPFNDTVPDSSGAGDSVVPRQGAQGFWYVIGDCLSDLHWDACRWCFDYLDRLDTDVWPLSDLRIGGRGSCLTVALARRARRVARPCSAGSGGYRVATQERIRWDDRAEAKTLAVMQHCERVKPSLRGV